MVWKSWSLICELLLEGSQNYPAQKWSLLISSKKRERGKLASRLIDYRIQRLMNSLHLVPFEAKSDLCIWELARWATRDQD